MSGIKDVAREAGVSTATVSHVVNNTRFVTEQVRNSRLDRARQTTSRGFSESANRRVRAGT